MYYITKRFATNPLIVWCIQTTHCTHVFVFGIYNSEYDFERLAALHQTLLTYAIWIKWNMGCVHTASEPNLQSIVVFALNRSSDHHEIRFGCLFVTNMIDWRFLHAGGVSHSIVIDDYCHMCVEYCGFTYKQLDTIYIYIFQDRTTHNTKQSQFKYRLWVLCSFFIWLYISVLCMCIWTPACSFEYYEIHSFT